jgi:hypothetical protein
LVILNPLSIGYRSGQAKGGINNQSLITGFIVSISLTPLKPDTPHPGKAFCRKPYLGLCIEKLRIVNLSFARKIKHGIVTPRP